MNEELFLRFGDWHRSETSRNYAMGTVEAGVSVYDVERRGKRFAVILHPEDCENEYGPEDTYNAYATLHRNGKEIAWLVSGDVTGVGHDGEPLIKRIKKIRELEPDDYFLERGGRLDGLGAYQRFSRPSWAKAGAWSKVRGNELPVEIEHPGVRRMVAAAVSTNVVGRRFADTYDRDKLHDAAEAELRRIIQQGRPDEQEAAQDALRRLQQIGKKPTRSTFREPGDGFQMRFPAVEKAVDADRQRQKRKALIANRAAAALRKQGMKAEPLETKPIPFKEDPRPDSIFGSNAESRQHVEHLIGDCFERLAVKWKLKPKKILGCGRQGCVVDAGDKSGSVIKFTTDAQEARISDWISKVEKPHRVLPKIKQVFDLSRCAPKWWAVVREDVAKGIGIKYSDDPGIAAVWRSMARDAAGMLELCARVGHGSDGRSCSHGPGDVTGPAIKLFEDEGRKDAARYATEFRDFLKWAVKEKAVFGDMHEENFGLREDGSLVLRDLGFSNTAESTAGKGVVLAGEATPERVERALRREGQSPTAPYACPGESAPLDLDAGREALEFLRKRTREDPWFAGLSLVFHSGPFPYSEHQMALEEALVEGPKAAITEEKAKALVCDKHLTGGSQRARMLPFVADKWLEKCGEGGCRSREEWEKFLTAIRSKDTKGDKGRGLVGERPSIAVEKGERVCENDPPAPTKIHVGMGAKIRELVREYTGDDDAIALDRHVTRWLCEDEGVMDMGNDVKHACKAATRGERCSGEVAFGPSEFAGAYETLKKAFVEKARKMNVEPAALQVAAWFARSCGSSKVVWLGASEKLKSSTTGTALCEVEKELTETCARPGLASKSGALRFCSEEKKQVACADFAKHKQAKKVFGRYRGGKRRKKGLAGVEGPSCDAAGVYAVKKLLDKGMFG